MAENNFDFAYDDAFRTMAVECDDILLTFLNYIFGEHYDSSTRLVRRGNEHYIEQQGENLEKRITDGLIEVIENDVSKKYHIECESGHTNGTILVRIFEYDAQIALDDAYLDKYGLRVSFPNTALLLLRATKDMPDRMPIEIETPGGSCKYFVEVIKERDFSIEDILEKRLYMLIPFYLFNREKELGEINEDEKKLNELTGLYAEVLEEMEKAVKEGYLSTFSRGVIIDLTNRVMRKLAARYDNVQRKVGRVMGGRVLDLDIIRERRESRAEGMAEGTNTAVVKLAEHYMKQDAELSREKAMEMASAILR